MQEQTNGAFIPGVKENLKYDLPAGLVVFLVALPLCLGIALASEAPLFSGVIAGAVGGLVVALLSGSAISVSGPAAGLAVIVAAAISSLGSFQNFLAAVVVAGVCQLLAGILRAGVIGDYVPNSVLKGMLAAIGLVIILKQIPHALGRDTDFEGDFAFFQKGETNTFTDIANAVLSVSAEALIISGLSIAILLLWERPAMKRIRLLQFVPGPLVVVVFGILMNELFRGLLDNFYLRGEDGHLVTLPVAASLQEFFRQFSAPNWAAFATRDVYIVGATIAVVASIESLLSLEASDKLDRFRRSSSTNRELVAQGIGNITSGLIGGLPITSVVVRTSANAYAGARTRMAAFSHGVLLCVAVLLIPGLLNRTPLCSLAAILIVVGYKLTKPALYRAMFKSGWEQFLPFVVTVVAIVFTDLLKGVLIGLVFGLFFVVRANHHRPITMVTHDDHTLIRFNKDMTFVNKSELKETLRAIPARTKLVIDASQAAYVDDDIHDVIGDFQVSSRHLGIQIEFKNFESKKVLVGGH